MSESKLKFKGGSCGRVVLLHFACRAPLPIGSSLRVTSSRLWSLGSFSTFASSADVEMDDELLLQNHHYANSVEMVTTPEEWPVWRTRTPVVVVLRQNHNKVEQHRYRYMVFSPGAENKGNASNAETLTTEQSGDETDAGTDVDDNNDFSSVGTEVISWEDPFHNRDKGEMKHIVSASSLPSLIASKELANLPYRTINIDATTVKVKYSQRQGQGEKFTSDGICIDTWNKADDISFCSYAVRDGINVHDKEKEKKPQESQVTGECVENQSDYDLSAAIKNLVSFNKLDVVIPNAFEDDGNLSSPSSLATTPKLSTGILSNTNASTKRQRIFFVCYHLPVIVRRDASTLKWSAAWGESILAATKGSCVVRDHEAFWVGTVSSNDPIITEDDRDAVRAVLGEMNCFPLFLAKETQEAHYYGMCKQVLWPAFHNIDLLDLSASGWTGQDNHNNKNQKSEQKNYGTKKFRFNILDKILKRSKAKTPGLSSDWDQSRLDNWWQAYCKVNNAFAEVLSAKLKPGDIMWVHDYHLSLLPKLVDDNEHASSGHSLSKKVFFLHIPFPTSQVFRELECGDAILGGMLHSNIIGFHAFDHTRHFLNASKRILGLSYEMLAGGLIGVRFRKKNVLVTMHNVSVEPEMVDAALALPAVTEKAATLRDKYSSRLVIAGVDITQRLSGISLKLLAFERFLTDYPIWREKVVMIQKCLLPCSRREDEENTVREVKCLVNRIQEKFGSSVIDYEEVVGSSLPILERLSLWKRADVLMITPIREGMNLLPLEYVFAKKKPSSPGVVISSEFTAVCSVLNGALRVNPFDVQMTVAAIEKALTMDDEEKENRRYRDAAFVQSSPSSEWTKSVLHDLNDAMNEKNYNNFEDYESEDTGKVLSERKDVVLSTAAFLEREKEKSFSRLNVNSVSDAYKASKNRVIILDLNGTVIERETAGKYLKGEFFGAVGNKSRENVSKALKVLCSDPRNTVFVVSGDSRKNVVNAIGNISGLGLAASNGACFAPPLKPNKTERIWKYFDLGVNWDAVKAIVLPVFAKYTARTNGSVTKMTHSSIGWSYYSCDPEWGSQQATHLVMELEESLRPFDVRFVMIKGIVEIVPRRLNKGLIVKNVLREVSRRSPELDIDFILCMGDDIHDEKMFTSVFSFIAELEAPTHLPVSLPVVDGAGAVISPSISSFEDNKEWKEDVTKLAQRNSSKNNGLFAFTVAVGKKESNASTYVDDANDVGTLLIKLSGI